MMPDPVRNHNYPERRTVVVLTLSARRKQLLQAIAAFVQEHRYAPTLRQLMQRIGARSTSSINWNLYVLERHGFVTFDRDANGYMVTRSLALTDKGREVVEA